MSLDVGQIGTLMLGAAATGTLFMQTRRGRRHEEYLKEINAAVNNVPTNAAGEKQPPLWQRIDSLREDVWCVDRKVDDMKVTVAANVQIAERGLRDMNTKVDANTMAAEQGLRDMNDKVDTNARAAEQGLREMNSTIGELADLRDVLREVR